MKIETDVRILLDKAKSSNHLAALFFEAVRDAVSTRCKPDRVEERSSIAGGRPWLSAIKNLPEPVKDGWGMEVKEDSICACKGNLVGLIDSSTGVFEFPMTKEEIMDKEFHFLLLTQKEQEEVVNFLNLYIHIDIEDFRATPLLGALVPLGCRDDSPNLDWNEKVKIFLKAEAEKAEAEKKEFFQEKVGMAKNAIQVINDLLEKANPVIKIKESAFTGKWPYVVFQVDEKEYNFQPIYEEDVEKKLKRSLQEYLSEKERYFKAMEKLNLYRRGELPIFTYGEFRLFLPQDGGNKLHVPSNMVGHVIGRDGEGIKTFSRIFGRRLEIIKIDEFPVSRKAVVSRVRIPEKPQLEI